MEPVIIRPEPRSRRRRSSGIGRVLLQLTFYFGSLLPMCIIAWKFDAVGLLRGNQPAQVIVQQPAQPEQHRNEPRTRRRRIEPHPPQAATPLPRSERFELTPRESLPPPGEHASEPAREKYIVPVKLNASRQHEPVEIDSDAFRVIHVSNVDYEIETEASKSGSNRATVTLQGPRPATLSLSLVQRKNARLIIIEPKIVTNAGRSVPFTLDNMADIEREANKEVQIAVATIAEWQAKLSEIELWLAAPGLKALSARNAAIARRQRLERDIAAGQKALSRLQYAASAAAEVRHFAEQVHKECELTLAAVTE